MEDKEQDLSIPFLILEYLKEQPQGSSIRDISKELNLNRNLVAKYLSILHMQGRVDLRSYGKVKIYKIAERIPFHGLHLVTNGCVIGLDQLLYVKEVQGDCAILIGIDNQKILYKPFSEIFHPALHDPEVKTFIRDYKAGTAVLSFRKEIQWRGKTSTLVIVPTIYDDGSCGLAILLCECTQMSYPAQEVKKNIETLHFLTKENPGFIVHMSAAGELRYINESYARYCGKKTDSVLHTIGIPLIAQDDFIQIKEKTAMIPNHETTKPFDISVVMDDGSVRWVEWIFYPVRESGILKQIHGYGKDITKERENHHHYQRLETDFQQLLHQKTVELREMTAKLRREIDERSVLESEVKRSEEKYRNLTEITTDIIWESDANGTLIYVNPKVTAILGYSAEQMIGNQLWSQIRPGYMEVIQEIFLAPEWQPFEQIPVPIIKPDHSEVWLELSGIPLVNEQNELTGYRGIGRDVTLFIATEESNKRLSAIIETTPDIVRLADIHGNLLYMNKAGRRILKIPDDFDITTCNNAEFMEPEDWHKILEGRSIALKEGIWQGITKLTATDGSQIPVSQVIITHKTGNGDEVIFSTVARNISDITRVSRDLENATIYTRNLIEVNLDPLITIGPDGEIQDVNRATEMATGYIRDELIGTDFSTYFSDPMKARRGYEQVFSEGLVRDYPLEMIHRNGKITPVLYNASVYKNNEGDIQGVFAAARDITEITRIQKELEDSYQYARTLIEVNLDPLVTIGPDGKIQDVNHATETVTGYVREELIGTDFCSYFSDPDKAREGYEQVFSKGLVRDYLLEIMHRSGRITPVLYNAAIYKNRDGEIQGVFAAARDISAMKQTERQIADSRDYYLKILDEFPNPIWRSGPDAECNYFNKSWLAFTGKTMEEEMGSGWATGVHPDDLQRCLTRYMTSFEKREPFFMVYRLHHHDGTYHQIADYGSPVYNLEKEFCGYIGSCYDLEHRENAW